MYRLTALVAMMAFGCARSVYPTPPPVSVPPTTPRTEAANDTVSNRARIEQLELQCRQQPGAVARSLSAVDEMRSALGSLCTVESVDNDPTLWLFRCQTDAFFPLGQFSFPARAGHACATDPQVRGSNGWVCAGAVLQRLLDQPDSGIESARVVFVGHVDQVQLRPSNGWGSCPSLAHAWHYGAGESWQPVPATDAAQLDTTGNNQLAWCRAASVAQQVLCGMRQRGGATRLDCSQVGFDADAQHRLSVGLIGASSLWQQRQRTPGTCPRCEGAGTAAQCNCDLARRVDVFVQFQPRESGSAAMTLCDSASGGSSDARSLYCLQECLEGRSVLAEELRLERHELFGDCTGAAAPAGWIEDVAQASGSPGASCVDVHRELVQRVLGL